ncbi:MAG: LysM peptidoglycan-binding domain-containing protein [Clostridiales bacterium]|nr:LysM peptidoglycan-binding domain-containing protein [Clostridiales bacterium]
MSRYIFKLDNTSLPFNPESITSKKTFDGDIKSITIEASGDLTGDNRQMYYEKLNKYFSEKRKITVSMPEFGVLNAEITELTFSVSDIPSLIRYSIKLSAESAMPERACKGYIIEEQETLFSLCNRLNLDLEEITALNAGNIKSFVLKKGDKIYLPEKEACYDMHG